MNQSVIDKLTAIVEEMNQSIALARDEGIRQLRTLGVDVATSSSLWEVFAGLQKAGASGDGAIIQDRAFGEVFPIEEVFEPGVVRDVLRIADFAGGRTGTGWGGEQTDAGISDSASGFAGTKWIRECTAVGMVDFASGYIEQEKI